MKITVSNIGDHETYVYVNGATLYFSYDTLVGIYHRNYGIVATTKKYSRTTSRHISRFCPSPLNKLDQEDFELHVQRVMRIIAEEIHNEVTQ